MALVLHSRCESISTVAVSSGKSSLPSYLRRRRKARQSRVYGMAGDMYQGCAVLCCAVICCHDTVWHQGLCREGAAAYRRGADLCHHAARGQPPGHSLVTGRDSLCWRAGAHLSVQRCWWCRCLLGAAAPVVLGASSAPGSCAAVGALLQEMLAGNHCSNAHMPAQECMSVVGVRCLGACGNRQLSTCCVWLSQHSPAT